MTVGEYFSRKRVWKTRNDVLDTRHSGFVIRRWVDTDPQFAGIDISVLVGQDRAAELSAHITHAIHVAKFGACSRNNPTHRRVGSAGLCLQAYHEIRLFEIRHERFLADEHGSKQPQHRNNTNGDESRSGACMSPPEMPLYTRLNSPATGESVLSEEPSFSKRRHRAGVTMMAARNEAPIASM